jgi:hypothetical protein
MTPRSSQAVDAGTMAVYEQQQVQNRLAETEKNQPQGLVPSRDVDVRPRRHRRPRPCFDCGGIYDHHPMCELYEDGAA